MADKDYSSDSLILKADADLLDEQIPVEVVSIPEFKINPNIDLNELKKVSLEDSWNPMEGASFDKEFGEMSDDFNFTGHGDSRLHDEGANSHAESPVLSELIEIIHESDAPLSESGNNSNVNININTDNMLVGGEAEDQFFYSEQDIESDRFSATDETVRLFDSSYDLGEMNPLEIEHINLDEVLDNYLSLSTDDVMNLSTDNHLTITGDQTDKVNLQGEWTQTEADSAEGFTTYVSGEASISIENHIVEAEGVIISG